MHLKILISILLLSIGGCTGPLAVIGQIYGGADAVTSLTTGKSATDTIISKGSDKDCRIHRLFKEEPMCKEKFKNIELKNNVITKEEFNKFKSQIKTKYYKPQNNSIEEAKYLLKIGVITDNEFNVVNDMRQRDSDKHKDMYINIILSAQSSLKKALKEI